MRAGTSLYRTLTHLYPRAFRAHYGDDLVVHFRDLVERDGTVGAWRRVALDLVVTVPRYRLESVMRTRRTTTFAALIVLLAVAAVGSFAAGFVPVAVVALALATAVAIAERGHLGALRPDGPGHRRQMLRWGAVLAGCCIASLAIGLIDLGGRDHWPAGRLLAYNATFLTTGIAAAACLLAGLRRPRLGAPGAAGGQRTG